MQPPRQPPPVDVLQDIPFPFGGVDLSQEFEEQNPGTCQAGNNVRAYEPSTQRQRGGSRPGLVQYVPAQVSGKNLIQDLNSVTIAGPGGLLDAPNQDPTLVALGGGAFGGADGSGTTMDPSDGGRGDNRHVRTGGSGIAPSRHTPRMLLDITANDQHQSAGDTFAFQGSEFSVQGLDVLDSVTHVTLMSTALSNGSSGTVGAGRTAPYAIVPSHALGIVVAGTPSERALQAKYQIRYHNGNFYVRPIKCPWLRTRNAMIQFTYQYDESTSPTNDVSSPQGSSTGSWGANTMFQANYTTQSIGDPFSRGSNGVATIQVQLTTIDNNPNDPNSPVTVHVQATLVSTGRPWTYLSGPPQVQSANFDCTVFAQGMANLRFFWTAVDASQQIGLVMGANLTMQSIAS